MPNVVDINIRADDNTGPGFASAEDRAKRFATGIEQSLSGLKGIAVAAGADLATSLAGPLVAASGVAVAAFASAGAAVGAFAAAAGPQLSQVTEVTDLYAKAQAAAAEGGEKAAKAQKAYTDALAKLPPATRATAVAFIGLKDDFKKWSDALAPKTMPVFTKGIEIMRTLLPQLTPLVNVAADALSGFMDELKRGAEGGGFARFIAKLSEAAKTVLPALLQSVKNVVIGFGGIIGAFLPFSGDFAKGIENMTKKFADFGRQLGQNPAFQAWMQDMQAKGPGILEMLGNLVKIVINVGQALAPFTGVTLAVAEALAKFVAAIPQGVMDWLAPAIAGIVLGIKAWAVAQGILNIALSANPIGIIVLAIAGLVAGLIYAYKHSETFREIVDGAFTAVKEIIGGAIDFVVPKLGDFKATAVAVWEAIQTAVSTAIDFLKPVLEGLGQFFTDTVIPGLQKLGSAFGDLGGSVSNATEKLKGVGSGLDDYGNSLHNAEGDTRSFAETVGDSMAAAGRKIVKMLSSTLSNIRDWMGDLARVVGKASRSLFDSLPEGLQDAARDVRSKVSDLRSWIVRSFSGAFSWLQTAGYNLVAGLAQGIYNGGSWISSALRSVIPDFLESYIPGFASGGIVGAAGGGPRSNMVMVGEQGRELVRLPFGSTVIPNGQTESMMSGGSDGGRPATLYIDSAGSRLDDLLVEVIRLAVRDRGGDVQVVLGR